MLKDVRGGDINIGPEHLRNIPIVLVEKEQQKLIIDFVDSILEAMYLDSNADTSLEEHEIDKLVYHLYGLTYDDVKIIDPDTSIKPEEY